MRQRYKDYLSVGDPSQAKRAFRTMNVLNSSSGYTSEEFHYLYDSSGRLLTAAFAQSPQTGSGAPTSAPFYTTSYPAATRARAFYSYDPAGRILSVNHWWDTWGGSSFTSSYILGNGCTYETSGSNRGLKTGNTFYSSSSGSPVTAWTESFGYDSNLDYLTSASYGDGQPVATPSWSYDAAGNRTSDPTGTSWTYDNLNRMTANGAGTSLTNDILGNRTALGSSTTYSWDCLNRMTGFNGGTATSYAYRADGMRVTRTQSGSTDRFRYDGQMPMETVQAIGTAQTIENGLGARGIDYNAVTTGSGTSVFYPLYDAHGNQVALLAESGSSFALSNQRSFGAWGEIRQGATSGSPNSRYCGNLGHVQDDESGLVYMRARYYEPGCGRFVSEDPARDGYNWTTFCANEPVSRYDRSGRDWLFLYGLLDGGLEAWAAAQLGPVTDAVQTGMEAYTIMKAAVTMWEGFLAAEGVLPVQLLGNVGMKRVLVETIGDILDFGPPCAVSGVEQRARAEAQAIASTYIISMWILDDSAWLN